MLIVQRYINMSQEEKLAADGVTVGAGVALLISLSRAIAVVKAGSVRCLGGCLNWAAGNYVHTFLHSFMKAIPVNGDVRLTPTYKPINVQYQPVLSENKTTRWFVPPQITTHWNLSKTSERGPLHVRATLSHQNYVPRELFGILNYVCLKNVFCPWLRFIEHIVMTSPVT